MAIGEKKEQINYSSRVATGALFKAVTLSTDPAHTLGFTASLIGTTRSSLIYKLEQKVPNGVQIPRLFNAILKCIAMKWVGKMIDEESLKILNDRIDAMFPSESMMKYGLEIYRDIVFCDDLHRRWKDANQTYIQSGKSWVLSNETIADINVQLMEIIIRHDLMEFPKGENFNADNGTEIGNLAEAIARREQITGGAD